MRNALVLGILLVAGCTKPSGGGTHTDGGIESGDLGGECPSSVTPKAGLVVTDRGPVQGTAAHGAWAYFAIPYAAPPVGDLRWAPPAEHACWSAPPANTTFAQMCLQLSQTDQSQVLGGEDCLYLNVWTPMAATATSKLPVLLFIHGGGNVEGGASEQRNGVAIYEGSLLAAATNSVVVTIDYRVGPMGWLANKSFATSDTHNVAGNYGTLDQIASLEWVQRNIGGFGGDSTRVMIFGQSAGAIDVCALVSSPLAKGLFAAALMESGACTATAGATATSFGDTFAQKVGCTSGDVAGCLRKLDANTIELAFPGKVDIASSAGNDFAPNVDGYVFADVPQATLAAGKHNHVPFIIGSNDDETGEQLVNQYPMGMTTAQFQQLVLTFVKNDQTLATSVMNAYPLADYGNDPRAAFIAITSDARFICPARNIARAVVGQQAEPVRRYEYTHHLDGTPLGAAAKAEGAFHGQELLPLFGHFAIDGYTPSAGEVAMSAALDGYWYRHAAAGDPDGAGAVAWPLYDATNDTALFLDETQMPGNGVRTTQCDFWDQALRP